MIISKDILGASAPGEQRIRVAMKKSEIESSGAGSCPAISRGRRLRESKPWGPQQKEEFASPEQDVQKTPSFKVGQALAMEADVESFAGALLDKCSHGGGIQGFRAEPAASGIQALELGITAQEKMVEAKILLIQ